ncbi:metal ABC transporter ATP-binding protein [Pseudobutyrivibrio xylanivorans]|uniref:Zinc transport system ATP-binding protein n=1 Tax=Pseudobutyrivibrio xylanivorans DSM 14809 TaxID=1123012 RepID=A0A1M6ACD8_PSEXY|nr:ABC transporter ATP-binding protein [Pseudobutyrivibrio xylanivorans]SHI34097.1 zinc transport system ATP-binding protein [Pseudobutyrivibrio xylanivorans DSM 14809]
MSVLSAKDLAVGYDHSPVLENINFTIEAGDYFCIVGENGSGKTTLMKTILGLQTPVSGKVEFGEGIEKDSIGYLPQQSDVQRDFPATVYEIVLSGCQNTLGNRFFYSKAQKEMALTNIKRMGILTLKNRCYRELSGGQQQRVLLARALCATQKLLLLDEPVAGLDPQVTEEMYELIEDLNKQGHTIIMISHDIENVKRYATKIFNVTEVV